MNFWGIYSIQAYIIIKTKQLKIYKTLSVESSN